MKEKMSHMYCCVVLFYYLAKWEGGVVDISAWGRELADFTRKENTPVWYDVMDMWEGGN